MSNIETANNSANDRQHSRPAKELLVEDVVDKTNQKLKSPSKVTRQRGYAPVENTLNSMTGDITFKELSEIDNISPYALNLKFNSDQTAIFQRKDYTSIISSGGLTISFENISLLKKFLSESGRIVPSRISDLSRTQQAELERAVKIARFLGLLPYVEYESM